MATYDLTQTTPTELKTGDIINVPYSGTYKTITLPKGIYKLEVWGAQGGSYSSYYGGCGGYSYGTLTLIEETTVLYCYAGGQPATNSSNRVTTSGGFNGGGTGYNRYYSGTYTYGQGGGGGSDIRINSTSLYARVIVAGGGGGSASVNAQTTKYGGGTSGGSPQSGYGASQTGAGTNGSFGSGGNATTDGSNYKYGSGGGGGGWYGGGACSSYSDSTNYRGYNGGGSGYVYTSSTASNYPSGCLLNSAYYLTDATTVAGNASFIDYSGSTVTGHSGNGCVRITVIKIDSSKLRVKTPTKYTKLSYIEGTGTQYIDTKFKANSNTRVVVDVENTHSSSTWIFGGRTTATQQTFGVYYTGSAFRHDYNNSYSVELSKTWSGRVIVDKNKNVLTVDGSSVSQTYADFSCDYPIWLFAMNMAGSPVSGYFKFRLYSCKIYDNDTLVRDFIPCKNINGDIGLYDLVHNEFYPNEGTGAFAFGETLEEMNVDEWKEGQDCYVKIALPYIPLSHIECTGTQYIDTGFVANQNTRVVMDCWCTGGNAGGCFPFGTRTTYGQNAFAACFTSANVFYDYGSQYQFADWANPYERMIIDANKNVATFKGSKTVTITNSASTFTTPYNFILLSLYQSGAIATDASFVGKFYSCQIYNNGVLIRDFIPVLDSSNIPCLYDKVEDKYYYNQGTGAFISGDILPSSEWKQAQEVYVKVAENLTVLDYLESTGTQYIDTGFKPNQDTRVVIDVEDYSSTSSCTMFGARHSYGSNQFLVTSRSNYYSFEYGATENHLTNVNNIGRIVFDLNKNVGSMTGDYSVTATYKTFTCSYPIFIFALNNGGNVAAQSSIKLYSCKIYDNGTLVRDYIPVLDNNNIPCLYDKVTQQCFYNQGTGNFYYTKPEVLPDGYTQLEYIQSDDACRIDTDVVIGSSDARIEMDIQNCNSDLSAQNWFTQFSTNYISSTAGMLQLGSYNSMWGYHLPNVTVSGFGTMTANRTKVNVAIANTTLTFSGDVSGSYTNANVSSGAYRHNGITIMRGIWRCYGVKIYVSNALVRNFIPCKNSSGTIGLYDLVNAKFYANVGTGLFIEGSIVGKPEVYKIPHVYWKQVI